MAHPYSEHRQTKVEHGRVGKITNGYASGGAVSEPQTPSASNAKPSESRSTVPSSFKTGGAVKARLDRPHRASGGRVKSKKAATTVNVIVAPSGGSPQATPPGSPPMAAAGPPMPMKPPMMPPPGAGAMPPGAPPMPMRAKGGRVGQPANLGKGTPVQNFPGKNDGKDIGRGKAVTYATGGAVEAKGKMAPHAMGGAGGGKSRLDKQNNPKKYECA